MSLEGVLAERGNQESTHRDLAHISSTNVSLWMDGWMVFTTHARSSWGPTILIHAAGVER